MLKKSLKKYLFAFDFDHTILDVDSDFATYSLVGGKENIPKEISYNPGDVINDKFTKIF